MLYQNISGITDVDKDTDTGTDVTKDMCISSLSLYEGWGCFQVTYHLKGYVIFSIYTWCFCVS